jgi:hypothetical protein
MDSLVGESVRLVGPRRTGREVGEERRVVLQPVVTEGTRRQWVRLPVLEE